MTSSRHVLPLLLAANCLAAGAAPVGASAIEAPPAASAPQRRAPPSPCPRATGASASAGRVTSKLRHIPDEDDPCADSRGVGHAAAPAASR